MNHATPPYREEGTDPCPTRIYTNARVRIESVDGSCVVTVFDRDRPVVRLRPKGRFTEDVFEDVRVITESPIGCDYHYVRFILNGQILMASFFPLDAVEWVAEGAR